MARLPQQSLGATYRFLAFILRPLMFLLTKRDWRGVENLPPEGVGCVVVVNHLSYFDPLVFAHFLYDNGRAPRMLAKSGVLDAPVIGAMLRRTGQIPVYRETSNASDALRAAIAAVKAGECICIYPEGTLTRDPDIWPMRGKSGAARVALETGCPVIPVGQWGPQAILAPYGKSPKFFPRKVMKVQAGLPVDLSEFAGQPVTAALANAATVKIMAAITEQVAQLREEIAPSTLFDPTTAGLPETGNPQRHQKGD